MDENEAKLKLFIMNSKVQSYDKTDAFVFFTNKGLPLEFSTRLQDVWDATIVIGKDTINIGIIIINHIIEFIQKNPNMAIGLCIGAILSVLVGMIPFLGKLLMPLALTLGIIIGGVTGHKLDRKEANEPEQSYPENLISAVKVFLQLLIDIYNSLKIYFKGDRYAIN
jgi:hypothetical protein